MIINKEIAIYPVLDGFSFISSAQNKTDIIKQKPSINKWVLESSIKMNAYKIEAKRIQFVHSYIDKEPTMVLIEGVRGARSRVTVEPPIIMYERAEGGNESGRGRTNV